MRHLTPFIAALLACGPGAAADTADAHLAADAAADIAADTVTAESDPASHGEEPSAIRPPAASILARYDFDEPTRRFDLPGGLEEVSGLAFTPEGRLFAHDDERGRIHEIDPHTGEVGKRFDLGNGRLAGDFEGIAVIGERFFLVTSTGWLYEFREGDDEENVAYRVTDTGLGDGCEVEGLDYDPTDDALLFACKTASDDGDWIHVHRIAVDPASGRLPSLRIPRSELDAFGVDDDFEPSALLVLPGGTYLLSSAPAESLLEVARDGRVLGGVDLGRSSHPQPEGLELGSDGTLYVADEENEEDARLTAYTPREGGGR